MGADRNDPVVQAIICLGGKHDEIRAIILTGSRANGTADLLSDYDTELFVTDTAHFTERDDWYEALGPVLVMRRTRADDGSWSSRLVHYQEGFRIDFTISRVEELRQLCAQPSLPENYDIGYEVLLDKDEITGGLAPPTHRAFIPAIPTEAQYADCVEGFWWNGSYIAKFLWRGDTIAAATWLDGLRQDSLRTMLEWLVETERGWSWRPGMFGKGLRKVLDPARHAELVATYGGGEEAQLWESLFRLLALFRKVAAEVGERLGYAYPHDLDARVAAYHRRIRDVARRSP